MSALRRLTSPAVLAGAGIAAVLLLQALPALDLQVSGWFYRPADGFHLGRWLPLRLLYDTVPLLAWGFGVVLTLGLALAALARPLRWGRRERAMLFLLLSLIVGPGLVTNTLLKDHWGRARPSQVTEFGGERRFTPVLEPSDQCGRNCSFPAGHPAMAFYPLSLLFLTRRQPAATLAIVGFGLLIGVVRIAQGGHFLSDVIAAGLVVSATAWLLDRWINRHDGRALARIVAPIWRAVRTAATSVRRLSRLQTGAVAAAAFALLLVVSYLTLDLPLTLWTHGLDPGVVALFARITQLGVGTGWLVGSAVLALVLWIASWQSGLMWLRQGISRWRDAALFFFVAVAASGLLADAIKIILGRARPRLYFADHLYGFTWFAGRASAWSMPSGHTTTIAAVATALAILWPRHVAAYGLVALLVAASRIAVGAHYLSDVMAGAALGIGTTLLLARFLTQRGITLRLQRRS